ncbi:hypothetical protein AUC45_12875 [Erythrobacter sp. YT30]|nr:hypothetical protein AUC45_12875 [Erythrobacter sp. YT30]
MGSIINVALPAMREDFATDAAGVQWMVNAYLLPLSALVLVGGSLGDHFGRRRCFLAGLAVFTLATLVCALSSTLDFLFAARFMQGIGAAMLAPNSLAIIADGFHGEERGKAVGTWAAAGAVAGAVAPLVGGMVIDALNWRWAFAIIVPLALAAGLVAVRSVRESRVDAGDRSSLDVVGAIFGTLTLGMLTFALIDLPKRGLGDVRVLCFAGGALCSLVVFLRVEKRKGANAMLPLGAFGSLAFTGISLLTLFLYAAIGGLMVLLPYVLIEAANYSATQAGAALLPFPLVIAALSRSLGGLAARIGTSHSLVIGSLIVAAGFGGLGLLTGQQVDYWTEILPPLILIAIGMSFCVAPLTTAVMDAVEDRFVGAASGINNATSRIAGLVATALLGFVIVDASVSSEALLPRATTASFVGAALSLAGAAAAWLMIKEPQTSN